ncbi:MAG: RsmB/NOP family class I SAM-dependent RNA methyltransferase [Burkholderiales bacterium]
MKATATLLDHVEALLAELLRFERAADQAVSAYFRKHRNLGQRDRAFVAETAYAVLRRRRTLEAATATVAPRSLAIAALAQVHGLSGRALEGALSESERKLVTRVRAARTDELAPAIRAELPDWMWERLEAAHGSEQAMKIARGSLNPAPLDLRVNVARIARDAALAQLASRGFAGTPTSYSPSGIRLVGRPQINRDPLFAQGLVEVQDEGSQLLAYLLGPRRGEMVADFCAGAGGKALALSMLMRGAGRVYAIDVSAKRLSALAPRAARAGVSNIHPLVIASERDVRTKRLARKVDRVLVDAPCSGFGTLRRNPDLKWRYGPDRIDALAEQQFSILDAASGLVKPGGRLVYATCSLLAAENEAVADRFCAAHPEFAALSCGELLAAQRIPLHCAERLRLWPHEHGTDGFFAAAFERR